MLIGAASDVTAHIHARMKYGYAQEGLLLPSKALVLEEEVLEDLSGLRVVEGSRETLWEHGRQISELSSRLSALKLSTKLRLLRSGLGLLSIGQLGIGGAKATQGSVAIELRSAGRSIRGILGFLSHVLGSLRAEAVRGCIVEATILRDISGPLLKAG